MARYTIRHNELVELEQSLLTQELSQLEKWLHSSEIDPDFDLEDHLYYDPYSGDRWVFLPELTDNQLFAMQMILSSSTVEFENKPIQRRPNRELTDE